MLSVFQRKRSPSPCFRYRPVYAWPVISLTVLLSVCLLQTSIKSYELRETLRNEHQQLLETATKQDEIVRGLSARMKKHQPDATAAMQVIAMRNPVAKLLMPDVAIMNLHAEPGKKRVRLEVKAMTLEALLDFSTRLEAIPARVELQNHTPAKGIDQKWAVNATLMVIYADNPRL